MCTLQFVQYTVLAIQVKLKVTLRTWSAYMMVLQSTQR